MAWDELALLAFTVPFILIVDRFSVRSNSFRLGVLGEVGRGSSLAGDPLGQAEEVVEGRTDERWRDPWKDDTAFGFLECPHLFLRRVGLILISGHATRRVFDPAGP